MEISKNNSKLAGKKIVKKHKKRVIKLMKIENTHKSCYQKNKKSKIKKLFFLKLLEFEDWYIKGCS